MTDYSWSYSAYSTAVQCLRKYKLCFIDKVTTDAKESGEMAFGSALHSAINAILTQQDGLGVFEIYWMMYKDRDVQYGRHSWEELASMGAEFIRKFEKFHARKYKLEFAEERLYGEYKGIKLEGTLDYLGLYNGAKALRDFKTSSSNYKPEKAQCATQLYLYSYLALQNKKVDKLEILGYTVFNKGTGSIQDLTWAFVEDEMYKALEDLVTYCKQIGEVKEHPRNLNACLDYNRLCPYYKHCHEEDV